MAEERGARQGTWAGRRAARPGLLCAIGDRPIRVDPALSAACTPPAKVAPVSPSPKRGGSRLDGVPPGFPLAPVSAWVSGACVWRGEPTFEVHPEDCVPAPAPRQRDPAEARSRLESPW